MSWDTYQDFPVMNTPPNWAQPVKQSFTTDVNVLQFLGIGRAWSQQAETAIAWEAEFLLENRLAIKTLRDQFDTLKGRWGGFWAPTWQADVKVTAAIASADVNLTIEDMQYGDYWGVAGYEVTGRYLMIRFPDGTQAYRRVTAWPTSTSLTLDAAVGADVAENELGSLLVSFLHFVRFDQDELVLEYLTSTVAKARLKFRAIPSEAPEAPAPTRIIRLEGTLAFGEVTVGETSQLTLTIYNDGNAALTVSSISYPTGFSGAWSGEIAASGSHEVTVTFAPTEAASYDDDITVNADETSGTDTIECSGTGLAAEQEQTFTVASWGKDGSWNYSNVGAGETTLLLGDRYAVLKHLWANFTGVGIPQGATILAATLTLKGVEGDGSFPLTVNVQALDLDDMDYNGFPEEIAAIQTGDRTTASVSWLIASWAASNSAPDIKDVIQEVVSRPGWASGNGLVIIGTAVQVYNKRVNVYMTDQGAGYEPALYVKWQE